MPMACAAEMAAVTNSTALSIISPVPISDGALHRQERFRLGTALPLSLARAETIRACSSHRLSGRAS